MVKYLHRQYNNPMGQGGELTFSITLCPKESLHECSPTKVDR